FESGVTGWTTSAGGTTQSSNPTPWDGGSYFTPGSIQTGIAEQTVDLVGAGYTGTQLDSQDFVLSFGGRVRNITESSRIILTFLNGSSAAIGSPVTIDARNVSDRWELVGARRSIPVGTRSIRFRFEST